MEERGMQQINSGTEVFDRDGHKLGTVSHVHELDAPGARGYLEVATGFLSRLGLGKHLYVPLEAVRDVTEGGVFLSAGRDQADQNGLAHTTGGPGAAHRAGADSRHGGGRGRTGHQRPAGA